MTPPAARGTRELAAYYDAEAATYEELWAPVLVGPGRALLDALPLQGARFVIDVGAGVGALLPTIVAAAPDATVIALDRSIGMLRRAATTTPRIVADAAAPAVRAGSMHVAVIAFVQFHLSDPRHALVQIRSILRRGGMLGTLNGGSENHCPAMEIFMQETQRM